MRWTWAKEGWRRTTVALSASLLALAMLPAARAAHADPPGGAATRSSAGARSTSAPGAASKPAADPSPDAALRTEVARQIEATKLRKAKIAVSIRDDEGREVVSIGATEPMLPASNMKLLTTGMALDILGSDFSFRTQLLRDGGRLIVVGDGDPAFGDPDALATVGAADPARGGRGGMGVEDLLRLWVRAVVDAGIASVDELIVDDRIFEREFVHPMWPKDQLNERYCAEVCGLNFHLNRLHITPRPVPGSAPDISRVEPAVPFLQIRNRATSKTGRNDSNTIWTSRSSDRNDLVVNGNVKQAYESPVPAVVHDMPSLFGEILAHRLRAAGVAVARVRLAGPADPPPSGTPVGPVIRTPIATAIERANTDSDNLYAEALFKRAAAAATDRPGSWSLGAEVMAARLSRALGDDASGFAVSDGSGLSRANRVTARGLSRWLDQLSRQVGTAEVFLESLAVGGRSGTVRKRFREIDPGAATIRCKTGYINGVSTLSGFVEAGDRRWTFSILGNELTEASAVAKVRQLQEQVVRAMVRAMPAHPEHPRHRAPRAGADPRARAACAPVRAGPGRAPPSRCAGARGRDP